jgi:hypothetical protein
MRPWEALAFTAGILLAWVLRFVVTLREDAKRVRMSVAEATPAQRRLIVGALVNGRLVSAPTRWWLARGR